MKRKTLHITFLASVCILLLQCMHRHKVLYAIPANYPEGRRKQLEEICAKGQVLYKINCSECHGIFTKGKDQVPNFSTTQLDNYSSRFIRRDPKNHAVAIAMNLEQLNQVLTFLQYKKRRGTDTIAKARQ